MYFYYNIDTRSYADIVQTVQYVMDVLHGLIGALNELTKAEERITTALVEKTGRQAFGSNLRTMAIRQMLREAWQLRMERDTN